MKFYRLKSQWEAEITFLPSISDIAMHPAYQQIIGLGSVEVPLILREMEKEPGHWFWALKSITGEDPVPPEHRGRINAMTEDWLLWGKTAWFMCMDEQAGHFGRYWARKIGGAWRSNLRDSVSYFEKANTSLTFNNIRILIRSFSITTHPFSTFRSFKKAGVQILGRGIWEHSVIMKFHRYPVNQPTISLFKLRRLLGY